MIPTFVNDTRREQPALPSLPVLRMVAAELQRRARAQGQLRAMRTLNKGMYYLELGLVPLWTGDGWLVPSSRGGGVIHRLEALTCSCEAGEAIQHCWHWGLVVIVEWARWVEATLQPATAGLIAEALADWTPELVRPTEGATAADEASTESGESRVRVG